MLNGKGRILNDDGVFYEGTIQNNKLTAGTLAIKTNRGLNLSEEQRQEVFEVPGEEDSRLMCILTVNSTAGIDSQITIRPQHDQEFKGVFKNGDLVRATAHEMPDYTE